PGGTIRYTTDGSTPTSSSSIYSSPILVDFSLTLNAATFSPDYTTSGTSSAAYTIVMATPTFLPDGGSYSAMQRVTITSSSIQPAVEIPYTTNGVDPTTSDALVANGGTVLVDHSLTLKARTFKAGASASVVKSATYTIMNPLVASGPLYNASVKSDGTVWS